MSYSYGDDVVAGTYQNVANAATNIGYPSNSPIGNTAEGGSGTKLKISFDAFSNGVGTQVGNNGGTNYAGVYFMYNCTDFFNATRDPNGVTPADIARGVLAFSPSTAWRATAAQPATPVNTTHVTINMAGAEPGFPNGSTTLTLTGTTGLAQGYVFGPVKVALPPGYLAADKSTWKHVFAARTGGNWQGHYIDNLNIRFNNFYEFSINGGASWSTTNPIVPPGPGTYSVDARYVSVPACFTNLGSVTINPLSFATDASSNNSCFYSSSQPTLSLSPLFGGATYQWDSSAAGLNNWAPITGATNSTYTLPQGLYSQNTDFRCNIICGGIPLTGSPSSVKTILVYNPIVTNPMPATRCGAGTVDLGASTPSVGATLKWYATPTGGSVLGTGSPFTTPVISTTTTYYVSAEIGSGSPGTGQFGTGVTTNTNTSYPAPLGTFFGGARHQMLILASELAGQGLSAGSLITGLTFNVANTNSANPMQLYTINMKGTTSSILTSTFESGLTEVFAPTTIAAAPGINTFSFNSSNFIWNGTDNIIVETIYNNNDLGTVANGNCSMNNSITGFTSVNFSRADNGGAGLAPIYALASSGTSTSRPNIQLVFTGGCPSPRTPVIANVTPAPAIVVSTASTICQADTVTLTASSANTFYKYTWNPGNKVGAIVKFTPNITTTYTVTALDTSSGANGGCQAIDSVLIKVNQRPTITSLTATPQFMCAGDSSQISLTAVPVIPPTFVNSFSLTSLTGQTYTQLSGGGITVINTTAQLTSGMGSTSQDDGGVVITLPFTFNYNGNSFTQMSMCTNGWVGCGNQGTIDASNMRLPGNLFTGTIPNNTFAAWFKDMGGNFPGVGSMRHGLIGTDVYAFQWDSAVGTSFSVNAGITISFQINIYGPASSSPGRIEYIYGPTLGAITFAASMGIENATGGTGNYINALNGLGNSTITSSAWPGNGNGFRFTPQASNTLSYAWSPAGGLTSTSISSPKASPSATTTYTVAINEPATGCSRIDSVKIVSSPYPKPYITPGDSAGCAGAFGTVGDPLGYWVYAKDSGAYAGGYPLGTTFDWSTLFGPVANLDSIFLDQNTLGNISVIVKLPTNLGGCEGNSNIFVNFAEPVQGAYMSQDSVSCTPNNDGMAIVQHLEANGPIRYVWVDALGDTLRDVTNNFNFLVYSMLISMASPMIEMET
nr:hypothetical protein [Bacteroidota bacterium]